MATVTKSIGTSSRDYSTISAWEADLDDTGIYSSGDTALGECYDDSDFELSSGVTINGGGTVGLDTRTLSAAVGQRHDGTANSGVRVLCTSTGANIEVLVMDSSVGSAAGTGNQIQFLEIDCNEKRIRAGIRLYSYSGAQNCLIHGARWTGSYNETVGIKSYSKNTWACNNIVYDIYGNNGSSNGWGTSGIRLQQNDWMAAVNNTVYGIITNSSAGLTYAYGIQIDPGGHYQRIYNNIAMGTVSDNGTATDFVTQTSTLYTDANYSSDTSAPGDTNYRSQSASATFISITAGSEDLHLLSTSNAIGVGKDAGASGTMGHDNRRMPYSPYDWSRDINNGDRNGFAMAWDIGASQYAIISTIGTNSRDYSTIVAWEADLDDTDYYGGGSKAKGECYDDSDFSISSNISVNGGGTVGLDTVILSVAAGQRHDGTAKEVGGSGVRFLWAADNVRFTIIEARESWVEWIDFDANGYGLHGGSNIAPLELRGGNWTTHCNGAVWCIVHDNVGQVTVGGYDHTFGIYTVGSGKFVVNCIVYNLTNQGREDIFGIYSNNQDAVVLCNNTVYNLHGFANATPLSDAVGFQTSARANAVYRNNIAARVYEATSARCYGSSGGAGGDINNLSTDDTAVGTNCVANVDYTTLFISTTSGSEDLHILSTSSAVGAGTDLGTHITFWSGNPTYEMNVPSVAGLLNRDINYGNRDAFSQTWDIGANQYEIIAKIGSNSRDYSTIVAWEADLDNTDYYGAGSKAKGECYDDSDFSWTSAATIDGGGTVVLGQVVLSVAAGQRHDGTAKEVGGSGVRLLVGADQARLFISVNYGRCSGWVEWLDFDGNNYAITTASGIGMISANAGSWYSAPRSNGIANCIIHDNKGPYDWQTRKQTAVGASLNWDQCWITNCIIYNIGTQWYQVNSYPYKYTYGLYTKEGDGVVISNLTIYNIFTVTHPTSTESNAYGWYGGSHGSNMKERNVIAARVYGAGNVNKCFGPTGGPSDYNLSTDDTATGSNSVHDVDYNDLFVSTSAGAEDLLLKDGSPALKAGDDMGNGPIVFYAVRPNQAPPRAGILPVDIKGRDRHAEDDETWDIGAHQCDSCSEGGATGSPAFLLFLDI